MGDGVGALGLGHGNLVLGDQWPGNRGAQQIALLVDSSRAEHGPKVILSELLAQIGDDTLAGPTGQGFFADTLEFLSLAELRGKSDYGAVVGLSQPGEDDGGIEAAAVSQDDFFDFF